ncbi:hypothetical protein EDD86DRAFT_131755 [Gorgonomyces haynaldii]|nr:hypothetical protein EDD86DRAFT_131755 [Gorgonomyces haynaldii]
MSPYKFTRICSTLMAKNGKQPKHNLKLPAAFKQRFQPPYEQYLTYLLEQTRYLNPEVMLGANRLRTLEKEAPRGTGWTVWISTELRQEFMQRKQQLGPITHGVFLEILLALLEQQQAQQLQRPRYPLVHEPVTPNETLSYSSASDTSSNYSCSTSPRRQLPPWLANIIHEQDL